MVKILLRRALLCALVCVWHARAASKCSGTGLACSGSIPENCKDKGCTGSSTLDPDDCCAWQIFLKGVLGCPTPDNCDPTFNWNDTRWMELADHCHSSSGTDFAFAYFTDPCGWGSTNSPSTPCSNTDGPCVQCYGDRITSIALPDCGLGNTSAAFGEFGNLAGNLRGLELGIDRGGFQELHWLDLGTITEPSSTKGFKDNVIAGTLPANIGDLSNLDALRLERLGLSGNIPPLDFAQYDGGTAPYAQCGLGGVLNHWNCPLPHGASECTFSIGRGSSAVTCVKCSPGAASQSTASACKHCPAGKWSPGGQPPVNCQSCACPAGQACPAKSSSKTACFTCNGTTFSPGGDRTCQPCGTFGTVASASFGSGHVDAAHTQCTIMKRTIAGLLFGGIMLLALLATLADKMRRLDGRCWAQRRKLGTVAFAIFDFFSDLLYISTAAYANGALLALSAVAIAMPTVAFSVAVAVKYPSAAMKHVKETRELFARRVTGGEQVHCSTPVKALGVALKTLLWGCFMVCERAISLTLAVNCKILALHRDPNVNVNGGTEDIDRRHAAAMPPASAGPTTVQLMNLSVLAQLLGESLPQICIMLVNTFAIDDWTPDIPFYLSLTASVLALINGLWVIAYWMIQMDSCWRGLSVDAFEPWRCDSCGTEMDGGTINCTHASCNQMHPAMRRHLGWDSPPQRSQRPQPNVRATSVNRSGSSVDNAILLHNDALTVPGQQPRQPLPPPPRARAHHWRRPRLQWPRLLSWRRGAPQTPQPTTNAQPAPQPGPRPQPPQPQATDIASSAARGGSTGWFLVRVHRANRTEAAPGVRWVPHSGPRGDDAAVLELGEQLILGRCDPGNAAPGAIETNDDTLSKRQAIVIAQSDAGTGVAVRVRAAGTNAIAIRRAQAGAVAGSGLQILRAEEEEATQLHHGDVLELDGFKRIADGFDAGPIFGFELVCPQDYLRVTRVVTLNSGLALAPAQPDVTPDQYV